MATTSFNPADDAPTRIGPYVIRSLIGQGAMGAVWLGYDPMLDRQVAIKVLAVSADYADEAKERLIREARAASALDHPNIVTVHQLGNEDGGLFIAMEYVEGKSLSQLVATQGALPSKKVANIVCQVADALGAAHEAGLVHRDVKPENIVLRDDGRAKILDFGLVHLAPRCPPSVPPPAPEAMRSHPSLLDLDKARPCGTEGSYADTVAVPSSAGSGAPTATQLVYSTTTNHDEGTGPAGTPLYMAPEQAAGIKPTSAADQFALAATAYELLTGRCLRIGSTIEQVLATKIPSELEATKSLYPASAHDVFVKALAPRPGDRYESVVEFGKALKRALIPHSLHPLRVGHISRRQLVIASLSMGAGAVAALSFFRARGSAGAPSDVLELAVVPGNRVQFAQMYIAIGDILSEHAGRPVRVVISKTYGDAIDGMASGRYQLAMLPPTAYLKTKELLPSLRLLGGRSYRNGGQYRSLVIARRNNGSPPGLDALKNRPFCFVDTASTSGYAIPRSLLRSHGLDPERDLEVQFAGDHFAVLQRVSDGTCFAGAVSNQQFNDAPRQGLATGNLAVLLRSAPLPPVAIVAHPDLEDETAAALTLGFAAAINGKTTSDLKEGLGVFFPLKDSAYDALRAGLR